MQLQISYHHLVQHSKLAAKSKRAKDNSSKLNKAQQTKDHNTPSYKVRVDHK